MQSASREAPHATHRLLYFRMQHVFQRQNHRCRFQDVKFYKIRDRDTQGFFAKGNRAKRARIARAEGIAQNIIQNYPKRHHPK